jgi:hypothetical protein
MGALDRIVVPKMKKKIVLTVGDYFKRVSYLSNFSNAVRCWQFLRKDQKKDPFPFLSYDRKSYCLIIVAWKQIPVASVLVHFCPH